MTADVFMTDLRTRSGHGLLDKLDRLFERAGFDNLIEPNDLVAIKLHFGERGNLAHIRPQYLRRIVSKVKARGGRPFLTDANTLYKGSRANAVDHLQTAIENGFDYAVVDAPLVIADGLNGKDYINVEINQPHFQSVKIGSAICHADSLLVVSHFKGHELSGFGGAIKNLGMGSGSRAGKQMMHSDVLPRVKHDKCTGCSLCVKWCPVQATSVTDKKASIDEQKCIGCGECSVTCPSGAIKVNWKTTPEVMQEKMAEFSLGAIKGKENKVGYISFLTNISPLCDCCGWNDAAVVSDIGILASRDPVAIDQAAVDLVNQQPVLPNTVLDGREDVKDKFGAIHEGVDWSVQLVHGERIGLGTRKYNLIKI